MWHFSSRFRAMFSPDPSLWGQSDYHQFHFVDEGRKKSREAERLSQGHTACQEESQEQNPGLSGFRVWDLSHPGARRRP